MMILPVIVIRVQSKSRVEKAVAYGRVIKISYRISARILARFMTATLVQSKEIS